jgi:hypothetical protein
MTSGTVNPDVMIDIVADDNATAALVRLKATLASLGGPIKGVTTAIGRIAERGNLAGIASQVGRVGGAFLNLGSQVTSVVAPVAALGGALSLAGIGASVQGFVQRAGELADASARLGVSVEALQEFRYAAGLVGVEAGEMDKALERLNKGLAEVADGKNAELGSLFKTLGISVRDSNGQIRSAADLMPQLAQAFEKNENPAVRTRIAMELFGKAGAALIPLLSQGADAMQASREEARKLGVVMGKDAVDAGDDLGDSLDKLKAAVTGLANTVGSQLAPILTPMVQKLTEWIAANREIVATSVAKVIDQIGTALAAVDWAGAVDRVQAFGAGISKAVEFVGGWENALIGLGVVMNTGLVVAIGAVIASVAQLGVVLLANPITGTIVAIAGAAALIYANWGPIAEWFEGIVARVKTAWGDLLAYVSSVLADLSALVDKIVNLPGQAKAAVGNFASSAANGVADFARDNAVTRLLGVAPDRSSPVPVNPVLPPMSGGPAKVDGQVEVKVTVEAPRGTQVDTRQSGDVDTTTRLNLGYQGGF